MKRLLLALAALGILLACASVAIPLGEADYLYVKNQAWERVVVYAGPQRRRVGDCESQRACRLKLRPTDAPDGTLSISFRESGWKLGVFFWFPQVYIDAGPWEIIIREHTAISTIQPAARVK